MWVIYSNLNKIIITLKLQHNRKTYKYQVSYYYEMEGKKSNLTQILERNKHGKPKFDLIPIERTAVNISTQEDYWDLMRIYECGGWKWGSGEFPTRRNNWESAKKELRKEICIEAGVHYNDGRVYNEGQFGMADKRFYQEKNWNIISIQKFYEIQKISPEMMKEVDN